MSIYRTYQQYRNNLNMTEHADLGDLNLYQHFQQTFPARTTGHKGMNIHRCHLAEDFIREYQLDVPKQEVAVSEGVRASLLTIMNAWSDRRWAIPSDQYPVYEQYANELVTNHHTYPTLTGTTVPYWGQAEVLLFCYPPKPSGLPASQQQKTQFSRWLAEDPNRHLILDCVYLFTLDDPWLWSLYTTGQVTVLYSLSKAYAAPLRAGFTITKDDQLREQFKRLSRWDGFDEAYVLLNEHTVRRRLVREQLLQAHTLTEQMISLHQLPFTLPAADEENPSYLHHIPNLRAADLATQQVIAAPDSVYGADGHGVIISTLGTLPSSL